MRDAPLVNTPVSTHATGRAMVSCADVHTCYSWWPSPTVIIADGAYGLGAFPGEPRHVEDLVAWYAPHIAAWSAAATACTSLWVWGTELSWATIHAQIVAAGWQYRQSIIWDKGPGHIAGRVNSRTVRGFPVVTELCAQYVRRVVMMNAQNTLTLQQWLRQEWQRSGLPFAHANTACGVRTAATRKYFATDAQWYAPSSAMLLRLAAYANQYGDPAGRPYFVVPASLPSSSVHILRSVWHHHHGITNVWREPVVRGTQRLIAYQKPIALMERIMCAASNPGDVVWEPFGGSFPAAHAAVRTGRQCYSAEQDHRCYRTAMQAQSATMNNFVHTGQHAEVHATKGRDR